MKYVQFLPLLVLSLTIGGNAFADFNCPAGVSAIAKFEIQELADIKYSKSVSEPWEEFASQFCSGIQSEDVKATSQNDKTGTTRSLVTLKFNGETDSQYIDEKDGKFAGVGDIVRGAQ